MAHHLPPPVTYPVGRSRFPGLLLAVLAAAWVAGLLLWALAWQGPGLGAWWWSVVVGAALLAWGFWTARRPWWGTLAWVPAADGTAGWRWHSAAYRHGTPLLAVRRVLDLQSVLLVHARTHAGLGLWLWLARETEPDAWRDLRRALNVVLPPPA